jgi:hypothetical protein
MSRRDKRAAVGVALVVAIGALMLLLRGGCSIRDVRDPSAPPSSWVDSPTDGGASSLRGAIEEARATIDLDAGEALDASPSEVCRTIRTENEQHTPVGDALLLVGVEHETPTESRTDASGVAMACAPSGSTVAVDAWDADSQWGGFRGTWNASDEVLVLVLVEPAVLTGIVVDEAGSPIAGARLFPQWSLDGPLHDLRFVRAWEGLSLTGQSVWTTASDGSFEIPVQRGGLVELHVEATDYATRDVGPIAVAYGASSSVRIVLGPESALEGLVLGEGRPIAGARISTLGLAEPVTTDEGGRFRLGGLAGNAGHFIRVDADGWVPANRSDVDTRALLRVELERPVRVRARAHLGAVAIDCPLDGTTAWVSVSGMPVARADWGVWIDVPGVAAGEHRFEASISSSEDRDVLWALQGLAGQRDVTLPPGESSAIDITLALRRRYALLEALVRDVPPSLAGQVTISVEGDAPAATRTLVPRGTHGCLTVREGSYVLVAAAPGWRATRSIRVAAGEHLRAELSLEPTEGERPSCCPDLETAIVGDALRVTRIGPGLTVPAGARIVAVDGAVGAASLLRRALCTTREGSTRLTLEVAGEEERVFEVVRRCDRRPIE